MQDEYRGRWKRFSVRTLLFAVTAVSVILSVWAVYVDDYRQQSRSLAEVHRLQGHAEITPSIGHSWQRSLVTYTLGSEAYVKVTIVDLSGKQVDDATLETLTGLRHLRMLSLDQTQITDAGMEALKSFPQLRLLSLRFTNVSDASTKVIGNLPNLNYLYLTHTRITDSSIRALAKLKHLKELYIRWTNITDAGLERLRKALPGTSIFHHQLEN